jgi:hypothetical protein
MMQRLDLLSKLSPKDREGALRDFRTYGTAYINLKKDGTYTYTPVAEVHPKQEANAIDYIDGKVN